ncbi:MAG: hypothetical protein OXB95_10575 [Rhodobacteraceae bacterium]|nr:hypothetical protein [Paracoccaceae bacterium]
MTGAVAKLACGSLVSDPGIEIEGALIEMIEGVTTPFGHYESTCFSTMATALMAAAARSCFWPG